MAEILGQGIQTILDDPNSYPAPNALIQDLQNNIPIEVTAEVTEDYEVTLGGDFATGAMLSLLLDPNFHADLQDPNCWYTLIDPNLLDKLVDPNIQAELQDPNLFAQFAQLDPNILSEFLNILSQLEDPI